MGPTIKEEVTVGAGAVVLGKLTVGRTSRDRRQRGGAPRRSGGRDGDRDSRSRESGVGPCSSLTTDRAKP